MNNNDNKAYEALIEACENFVNKVDAGKARSKNSYKKMKDALRLVQDGELSDVTISSTNSELGSYHWFHTLISMHKSTGEFLKDRIPDKHIIHQWGKTLYETSQELLKGYEHINRK